MKKTIPPKKKILAISGSTRKDSTNLHLIKAITALYSGKFEFQLFESIADLPPFNPDNIEGREVINFRKLLRESDVVLICTPEYAHGVPGSLKNAIDWTVTTSDFSGKPTILITASSDGQYAHPGLLETLRVIEAKQVDQLQLLISFAKTKINGENKITDSTTLQEVQGIFKRLDEILTEENRGDKNPEQVILRNQVSISEEGQSGDHRRL